ncbi:unnamed protein product [Oikopleura dioica]|uniref:Sulfotransferase n=1 Tax=Oikopleura dioica TaxID=34765 RepID=E4XZ45_OIKDI|nr:unnamed protein product [Oikopleura dioica]
MGRVELFRKLIPWALCISILLLVFYRDYEELVDYRGLTENLDYASQRIQKIESRLDTTTLLPSRSAEDGTFKIDPVESVFFLKTYKTGSSTLATIFSRNCFIHNRSMLLTKQNIGSHLYPYGGEPAGLPFNPSLNGIIGWQKQSKQYDFVVNHMTYNFTFADEYLPSAKKISILRHPASLMTSTWKYYFNSLVTEKNVRDIFPTLRNDTTGKERVTSLYRILADPIVFYEKSMTVNGKGPAKWKRHLLRPQLFSFMGPEVLKMNLDKDVIHSYLGRAYLLFIGQLFSTLS